MDEAEYDMKDYADRGGCYPPKPAIIRKPNSIIVLLFIQNISRAGSQNIPNVFNRVLSGSRKNRSLLENYEL